MERVNGRLRKLPAAAAILAVLLIVSCVAVRAQEQPQEPHGQPPRGPQDKAQEPKQPEKDSGTGEDAKEKPEDGEKKDPVEEKKEDAPPKYTKEQIERAYPVGERLTYNISYAGIHAGTAVLEVNDKVRYKGRECFRIRSRADSARLISLVYKVEDRLQTYVDAETLEPLRSDKKMREGSHRREEYIIYAPKERKAGYHKKKKGRFVLRREHTKVPYGIQGSLSSLYFLRTMKLEVGKTYTVTLLAGRRITKGAFEITKKKKIKIPGVGTFTGLRISPKFIEIPGEGKMKPGEGLFVASGDSEIWVDEATGMPLVMYVDIPILSAIRVRLCKKEMVEKKKK